VAFEFCLADSPPICYLKRRRTSGILAFIFNILWLYTGTIWGCPRWTSPGAAKRAVLRYHGALMRAEFLISAFVTLLVVVDPLGLVPAFIAVTHDLPARSRRAVALRACLIAALILAGSALAGDWLLRTLAITLPAFRIAGGLLLFSIASEMVFGVRITRQSQQAEEALDEHVRNIAAFPLAIPLMAGPGAIAACVLLAGRVDDQPLHLAVLLGVIVVVMAICLAVFTLAAGIARLMGTTGNVVASRLLGVLLAALAVQFVIDGVRAALV
jgi:multiple antibiotic resistance protein